MALRRYPSLGRTALALALACPAVALAQEAQVSGQISDPTGAAVPAASISITNESTGVRRTASSNQEGNYAIPLLQPGNYSMLVQKDGFRPAKRNDITLQVNDRVVLDYKMDLGAQTETVTVAGQAPLLRAEDAQSGEVVTSTFIANLPQLQRDPLQLLTISGNVQGSGLRAEGGSGDSGSDTRINGGRTSAIEYMVDGVTASTGVGHGVVKTTPKMEAVAEFKVITNGISAEYGRMSGGGVELVTKSGGNQLHGQLFEYFQNDKLNANSWEQNWRGGERTPFRNNDFGFAVGGPVMIPKLYRGRDKTFFFANYEGLRFSQAGELQGSSVPTEAERRGDFTATVYDGVPAMLYDPAAPDGTLRNFTNSDGSAGQARTVLLGGDGKHVPQSRMSPLALALQEMVPLPTPGVGRPNSSSADNYQAPQDTKSSLNAYSARIDHNFSDRHRLFGRFAHQGSTFQTTPWRGPLSVGNVNQVPDAWGTTLGYDWIIRPSLVFTARLGGTFSPVLGGARYGTELDTANLPLDATTRALLGNNILPGIHSDAATWNTEIADSPHFGVQNSTTYDASASVSKFWNKHAFRVGFETRRYYDNFIDSGAPSWPWTGYWVSNGNPVNQMIGDIYDSQADANAYAGFLLGTMGYATISSATNRAEAFNYYAGYAQDDFKISPKLTLNLGLRWDMETPLTERYDRFYFWDPDAPPALSINAGYSWTGALQSAGIAPGSVPTPAWVSGGLSNGAIQLPNTKEFPSRKPFGYHWRQFAPRLGFAYQLTPSTVLRGSFGQMYMSAMANPNSAKTDADISISDSANSAWHRGGFAHYAATLEDPYDQVAHYTRSVQLANYQVTGDSTVVSAFNKTEHMPYELTWSFGIQRQLPKGFLVEALYSANQGHELLSQANISQFPRALFVPENGTLYATEVPSPFAGKRLNTSPTQQLARLMMAYPQYGGVKLLGNNLGRSNYNSLNLRAERRLWQGMTFLVNYTFAKMLDNVGGGEANADNSVGGGRGSKVYQSVDSIDSVYGYSPYDETHRLAATYSVELPIGRGKLLLGNPTGIGRVLLNGAVGGWQFAGVTIYRSGRPLVFDYATANVNNPWNIEYTFGSYATADTNILNSSANRQAIFSSQDTIPENARVFDNAKIKGPATFTYGTLPPVYYGIRNPGNVNWDLSLMKRLPFSKDGGRFLQLRLEAQNAFNIRGLGHYGSQVGSIDFGLITSAGNIERRAQVSARIMF